MGEAMQQYEPKHAEAQGTWKLKASNDKYLFEQCVPADSRNNEGVCMIHRLDHAGDIDYTIVETDSYSIACGTFVRLCVQAEGGMAA